MSLQSRLEALVAAIGADIKAVRRSSNHSNDRVSALGKLEAGIAARKTSPCRLAFVGSSTTYGNNASVPANRFVNIFVSTLQKAYPSGLGSESTVVASDTATWGTLTSAAGIHGYNGGDTGTTSADYLTAEERTSIASLQPSMVMHMVGSNDYATSVPLATFKANVLTAVNSLKSQITKPCVQILVHSYGRFDNITNPIPWNSYGKMLQEIAEADPDNVVFIDISEPYRLVGIPGSDPLNLIDTDNIHQFDSGHALMADLLLQAVGLSYSNEAFTTSSSSTGIVDDMVRTRFTSDTFSGANSTNVVGRTSDAILGGTGKPWIGTASALGITNTQLVRSSVAATWAVGFAMPHPDYEVSMTMPTLSSVGIILDFRRAQLSDATAGPDGYRLDNINSAGALNFRKRVSGTTSDLIAGTIPVATGQRVAIRGKGSKIQVLVDNVIKASVTDTSIPAAGNAAIASTSASTGFAIDNFVVDLIS